MAKDSKVFAKNEVVKWSGEGREGNYRIASVNKTKKTANMRGLGSTKAKVPFKAIPWSELTHTDDRPQMSYERYRSMEDGGAFSLSEKERKEWEKVGAYIKERNKKLDDLDRKIGRLEAEYMDKYDTKEQKASKEAKALNKEIYALHSEYSNLSREADKLSYTKDYHKKRKSGKMADGGSISKSELEDMFKDDGDSWKNDEEFFKIASDRGFDYDQDKEEFIMMETFNDSPYGDEYDEYAHGGKVLSPKQRMFKNVLEDLEKQGHLDMPNPTRDIHHIASTSVTTSTGVKKQLKELRRLKHLDLSDNNINIIASKFGKRKMASGGLFDSEGRKYSKKHGAFLTSEWFSGDLDFLNY